MTTSKNFSKITRHRIQSMIREAVRARMGLIAEGTATDKTGALTISGTVDSFSITAAESTPTLLSVYARGPDGDSKLLWSAEQAGRIYSDKTWPGLRWLAGSPAGAYTFQVEAGSFDEDNKSATPAQTIVLTVDLEAAAASAAADSTPKGSNTIGFFGEYSDDREGNIFILPRDNGDVSVYDPDNKSYSDPLNLIAGQKYLIIPSAVKSKTYIVVKNPYNQGDSYDVILDGSVTPKKVDADGNTVALEAQPPVPPEIIAAAEKAQDTDLAAIEAATGGSGDKPTYMPKQGEPGSDMDKLDPQLAAGDVQEKIRKVGVAVQRDFSDITEEGVITLDEVAEQNPLNGHTWITNSAADRESGKFKLNDWSNQWGDPYTYFALINDVTGKPIAFVVASDPQDNNHYSTGRFIGPDSVRPNLRRAFCYLYHRATGEVHDTCLDGPTKGPDDDIPKGSGGAGSGKGKGKGAGGGSGSGAGTGGREDDIYKKGKGPGAVRLVSKDGHAVTGKGDIMTGIAGIGLRPAEKLRGAGRKIITKSKDNRGFPSFPKGPGNKFLRNPISAGGGKIPPSALGVFFQHPMAIITDAEGNNPYVNFGKNTSPENILKIRMGWGAFGRIGLRGALAAGLTLKPGDDGFDEAAAWILSHQEEFDLRPDGFVIEDPMSAKDTSSDELRGEVTTEDRAINEARRTRSLTPLFDRYRF